jgi:hypothetical protein
LDASSSVSVGTTSGQSQNIIKNGVVTASGYTPVSISSQSSYIPVSISSQSSS